MRAGKIMLNYWKAVAALLDSGKPTVLFKSVGVELFCRFSTPLFHKLQNLNNFKVSTIRQWNRMEGEVSVAIADGPDEVHEMVIARRELGRYLKQAGIEPP